MFIERKLYPLGNNQNAISYEIHDDNGHVVQLTPQETETLHQWLASKSVQIHNDVNGIASTSTDDGEVNQLIARWKGPKTKTVHLANGGTVETEINGRTLDGSSGYILLHGKDVNVDLIDGHWREQLLCSACHKPVNGIYTHTENGVKLNYCSYCYMSQFD